jgi:hypothetical protein
MVGPGLCCENAMSDAFIKFYYVTALVVCATILAEMAVVEYRGLILPPAVMCLVLVALGSILVGDWHLQTCIKRSSVE